MADSGPGPAEQLLSFAPLWRRTLLVVHRHRELLLPLAGAAFFLPQLLFALVEPERQAGGHFEFSASLPVLTVLVAGLLLTIAGQVVVAFVAVHDGTAGLTFGQVITRAAGLLGPACAVLLLQGLATFAGILLLIVPGLVLFARLSVALPLLATATRDPLQALRTSWRLTDGLTLRILGSLLAMLALVFLFYAGILSFGILLGGPGALAGGGPWSIGRWVMELLGAGAVAAIGVVSVAFYGSLLVAIRSLRPGPAGRP